MKLVWIGAGFLVLPASLLGSGVVAAQTQPGNVQTGQNTAQSPDSLTQLLKSSEDVGIRARAARDIGKSRDSAAIPALSQALNDPSDKVRREVIMALAAIHRLDSLEALITATRDTDPDVRTLAVQSVIGYYTRQVPSPGFTGTMKKEFRRAKQHFAQDETQIDPGTLVEPKAIAALDTALKEARSLPARREAAKGLGILTAQSAVPDLVRAAHAFDEGLARESLNALAKIKDRSAGPQLIDLLGSPRKDVKHDAAVTVGILRARDALPKLQAMVENDPDSKTREKALEGLAYIGDPVSVPTFIKALWNHGSKDIRIDGAEGLARAGDPKTLPELQKAVLMEKDASVRLAILFAITALGKDDYLSAMIDELGSRTRGDSAEAYFIELSRDPKFLRNLYPYLSSHDSAVRRRLARVLMFTGDTTSLGPLDQLARDSNGDVATAALRARASILARTSTSAR